MNNVFPDTVAKERCLQDKDLDAVKVEWKTLECDVLSKISNDNKRAIRDIFLKDREAVVHPHVDISTIWNM